MLYCSNLALSALCFLLRVGVSLCFNKSLSLFFNYFQKPKPAENEIGVPMAICSFDVPA
jgi:hypothetical protein